MLLLPVLNYKLSCSLSDIKVEQFNVNNHKAAYGHFHSDKWCVLSASLFASDFKVCQLCCAFTIAAFNIISSLQYNTAWTD